MNIYFVIIIWFYGVILGEVILGLWYIRNLEFFGILFLKYDYLIIILSYGVLIVDKRRV